VAVINVEPNVVKTFKTISYEGSQAHVTNPGAPALENPHYVNQNNALAWALNDYNANLYPNVDGWKCVDIKTDLDDGKLLDFIKKEGKWFGYIRGKHIVGKLDASKFSVQGIGKINDISSIVPMSQSSAGASDGSGTADTTPSTGILVAPPGYQYMSDGSLVLDSETTNNSGSDGGGGSDGSSGGY